ncbi:MAG: ATP-grasp domain-containing protein [Alphaproteobacteria bacterium]|nr:ATP-grasp domain-containing protein [Alphaproteobacteria bacterium]
MARAKPRVTVLLGDPGLPDRSKPGGRYNPEDLDAMARMKAALAAEERYTLDFIDRHEGLPARLAAAPPDFVLNLCDVGYRNRAERELHIPALLDLWDIPYSGSGPAALAFCVDKAAVLGAARDVGVPVPGQRFYERPQDFGTIDLPYPLIVKPNRTDGSFGITRDAVVRGDGEARACLAMLAELLPGEPVLLQEYLEGREFSVGVLGNAAAGYATLPPLEVDYSGLPAGLAPILSYESKSIPDSPYWIDISFRRAALDTDTEARLRDLAVRMMRRTGCRDYARCDFRTGSDGTIRLLEVNPNPAWAWDGKLALMAGFAGWRHGELLCRIVDIARARCGLTG